MSDNRGWSLVIQETQLKGCPPGGGEATQAAVAADDPVAWDEQRNGVSAKGTAYGPGRPRPSYAGRQVTIGYGLAESHLSTGLQDLTGKTIDPLRDQGDVAVEINLVAYKVGDDLLLDLGKEGGVILNVL
jgi:hypothetical protein